MGHGPIKNEVLLAKIETTYGTDPTPVEGTNAILFSGLQIVPFEKLRMFNRPAVRASLAAMQHIFGGALGACRFSVELKGSGAAGTAPEYGPLLRACGLGQTISASTSVTYAPVSTGHESVTLYGFEFGRVRHIFIGCRGNATLRYTVGEPATIEFEFIGKRGTVTDQTQPTPVVSTIVPQAVKGMAATIGGVSGLIISDFELNLNNQLECPGNLNDSMGYGNVTIVSRDVSLSLLKHAELVATINPYADLAAGTARAFASGALGATAGNIINLAAAQMHYRDVAPGDGESFRNRRLTFGCHESSTADTDFSLVLT